MRCWTTLLSLGDAGQTLFANVFFASVFAGAFSADLLRRHALSDERASAPSGSARAHMARGWHCTLLPETAAASCAIVVINYDLSKANKLRGPERIVLRGREIVVGSRTVPVSACAKPSENLSEKR